LFLLDGFMVRIKVTMNNYTMILRNPGRFPPAVIGAAKALKRKLSQKKAGGKKKGECQNTN
jgi:hypothetical protein